MLIARFPCQMCLPSALLHNTEEENRKKGYQQETTLLPRRWISTSRSNGPCNPHNPKTPSTKTVAYQSYQGCEVIFLCSLKLISTTFSTI